MGNYISRHAVYSTKEDGSCKTSEHKYEDAKHRVLELDPRSPTAEIVRTPIHITVNEKLIVVAGTPNQRILPSNDWDTPTSVLSTMAVRSSDVDLPSLGDLVPQDDSCSDEFEDMMGSIEAELAEIEKSYKSTSANYPEVTKEVVKEVVKKMPCHKLQFTPEKENIPKFVPKKSRNPLSVRSTNTADVNSPSSYLRLKQQHSIHDSAFQKFPLKQNNSINCENTPPHAMVKAATLPRRRPMAEWDKDATMII